MNMKKKISLMAIMTLGCITQINALDRKDSENTIESNVDKSQKAAGKKMHRAGTKSSTKVIYLKNDSQ